MSLRDTAERQTQEASDCPTLTQLSGTADGTAVFLTTDEQSRPPLSAEHLGSDTRQSPAPNNVWTKSALLLNKLPICRLGGRQQQQQESTDPNYDTCELSVKQNRTTEAESGLGAGREDVWEGWGEVGVGRCKLLDREWIHNEVLLYSPGDCIQHPGRNHNGKEYFF